MIEAFINDLCNNNRYGFVFKFKTRQIDNFLPCDGNILLI